MPVDIEICELTLAGMCEPSASWTKDSKENIILSFEEILNKTYSLSHFSTNFLFETTFPEFESRIDNFFSETRWYPSIKSKINGEIEVFGLDKFEDSAIIIKGRIPTVHKKQWIVKREFNRRVKLAFDKSGIEIPFPKQQSRIWVLKRNLLKKE